MKIMRFYESLLYCIKELNRITRITAAEAQYRENEARAKANEAAARRFYALKQIEAIKAEGKK